MLQVVAFVSVRAGETYSVCFSLTVNRAAGLFA